VIVVYCQHRETLTGAERSMVASMRDLPGVLLVNPLVTTGRRTREIDGVWLRPDGVVAIEVKGTGQTGAVEVHQNGPWRIGGAVADFPSGPNPLLQARTGAQTLKRTLTERGVDVGFIPAVLAVAGTGLSCVPQTVGDLVVLTTDDLPTLPTQLRSVPIGSDEVLAVLSALDLAEQDMPDCEELAGEGFAAGSQAPARARGAGGGTRQESTRKTADNGNGNGGGSSRDRRRARRFADLEAQALADWRRTHRRRLISSALAAAALCGILPQLPIYCTVNGLLGAAIFGAYQLAVRRRKSGPRDQGWSAIALWLLTLIPIVGIGASLSWMAALPVLEPIRWPFVLMLAILIACGLGCAVLAGRSGFVHPPAVVIERYDEKGRPTGAFMLADANPLHFPGKDWQPVQEQPAAGETAKPETVKSDP
jgi:hypothetical protein